MVCNAMAQSKDAAKDTWHASAWVDVPGRGREALAVLTNMCGKHLKQP